MKAFYLLNIAICCRHVIAHVSAFLHYNRPDTTLYVSSFTWSMFKQELNCHWSSLLLLASKYSHFPDCWTPLLLFLFSLLCYLFSILHLCFPSLENRHEGFIPGSNPLKLPTLSPKSYFRFHLSTQSVRVIEHKVRNCTTSFLCGLSEYASQFCNIRWVLLCF